MIKGKLVVLRSFEHDDLPVLHKWHNDPEIMRPFRSQPDHVISTTALESEFDGSEDTNIQRYVIEAQTGGKLIGWCVIRLNTWAKRTNSADIALCIGEKRLWRKGYGTEVGRLLLQQVFEQLNINKVGLSINSENRASLALAKKLGFKEEGRLRSNVFFDNQHHDSLVFGLLKSEYRP